MARKLEIKTMSYVHVGDKLVSTDDLTQEQRKTLATWLKVTYLNEMFRGEAEFYAGEEKDKRIEA